MDYMNSHAYFDISRPIDYRPETLQFSTELVCTYGPVRNGYYWVVKSPSPYLLPFSSPPSLQTFCKTTIRRLSNSTNLSVHPSPLTAFASSSTSELSIGSPFEKDNRRRVLINCLQMRFLRSCHFLNVFQSLHEFSNSSFN